MGTEGVRAGYDRWSTTYDTDRNLTRDLDAQVTASWIGEHHFASMIECGCGTGKNTRVLARHCEDLLALDASSGMLALAQQKVKDPHVRFVHTDITQPWPSGDRSADAVVANLVLEHISDLAVVFGEAARVLRNDGVLFICELHPFKQYMGSKARFQQSDVTYMLPAYIHHISDFTNAAKAAGLTFRELREWWHTEDTAAPPRLISFEFAR